MQQVSAEKVQQHNELSQRVHELELALASLRQQASTSQNFCKELKYVYQEILMVRYLNFVDFLIKCVLLYICIQIDTQLIHLELG